MRSTTLSTALLIVAATAAPPLPTEEVATSVASKETCITKYRSRSYLSAPVPMVTNTITWAQNLTSTTTVAGDSWTTTVTVTPRASTSTILLTNTSNTLSVNDGASITRNVNAIQPCSLTTTVTAGTSTVYTGEYNGTLAKRTAGLLDRDQPRLAAKKIFHFLGKRAGSEVHEAAAAVDCTKQVTTYFIITSTMAEKPVTRTVTLGTTATVHITQVSDRLSETSAPLVNATRTDLSSNDRNVASVCTVTSAVSTTTQHVKCAPTNLISSVNGHGIGQTGGSSASTRGLAPGSDPSACCQLCVDDDVCAASEDDPTAENCFLWYTTPTCGLGLRYSDGGQNLPPGSGFLLQTGCGEIEAVDSF